MICLVILTAVITIALLITVPKVVNTIKSIDATINEVNARKKRLEEIGSVSTKKLCFYCRT